MRKIATSKTHLERSLVEFMDSMCKENATDTLFENQMRERWLKTPEAAAYLRVSVKRLYNMTSNGRIKFHKFGRSNRYLESELKDLLVANSWGGPNGN